MRYLAASSIASRLRAIVADTERVIVSFDGPGGYEIVRCRGMDPIQHIRTAKDAARAIRELKKGHKP